MLAVLFIEIEWVKPFNNTKSAELRKPYLKPVMIDKDVLLDGEGVFFKCCHYSQHDDGIFSFEENHKNLKKEYINKTKNKPFTQSEEREQHYLYMCSSIYKEHEGTFQKISEIDIPCISIIPENEDKYMIKWFDFRRGAFIRRGGNEDLYNPMSPLCGQPNILNETAFILNSNQSGKLEYNYRFTTQFDLVHYYRHYCVYMVNTPKITRDIFLRDYDFNYKQIDRLF